jgi:retron-type reverse transcriptase
MDERKRARKPSVILYVDIRKAFDHVIRRILIQKLTERIKSEDTLSVLKSLLSDTSIRIGDTIIPTNVGVPQGGILSPILFNLYVDEALRELAVTGESTLVLAYADNILVAGDPNMIGRWQKTINGWGPKWNLWVEWNKSLISRYR